MSNGKNRQELAGNDRGMDQGTENLSPSNLNRYEVYSRYRFKKGSKLRAYLADKNIARKINHLLIKILVVIKDTVLHDPKNKAAVMCNPSLADTHGGQDYHVSEIRSQVLQQDISYSWQVSQMIFL